LTLAFDGAAYHGWQRQVSGHTVQNHLEAALARLFPSKPETTGSSRTDAGVHARGMVVHFDVDPVDLRMAETQLALAINALLPADIRVQHATLTEATFHARFDALGKQYRYHIWNAPTMNPLRRTDAWHVPKPLDLAAMRAAAVKLIGRHDFRAFTSNRGDLLEDPVRTLRRLCIRRAGPLHTFVIEGDGFLYKMCRGIVGTLVLIGQGEMKPGQIDALLASGDRSEAGPNAPAHGLVLWKVFYPDGKGEN
jgi:tRNA pseudouridine38-40 synthase